MQLVRAAPAPLEITIVEPRAAVGPGLAYGAEDPDHRLNGSPATHVIDPQDPGQLQRWCDEHGVLQRDPEAVAPDGTVFLRRGDFGDFLADALRAHAAYPRTGSSIRHCRDMASDALLGDGPIVVLTARGASLASDLVVVATGNSLPRLPAPFSPALAGHPGVIADPADTRRLRSLPKRARVLVLGSGLTALDVISTLVRSAHQAPITVISRRGLRPRAQRPPSASGEKLTATVLLERIEGPVPGFIADAGTPLSARVLLRALRREIRRAEQAGDNWYAPFDDLRDVLWKVWPRLPATEKRRVLRHLRPWYDAHRFRAPPQNEAMVRDAESRGLVAFRAARVGFAEAESADGAIRVGSIERGAQRHRVEVFDAVVNCTGFDGGTAGNPLLAALLARGLVRIDPSGVGFAVDSQCRAIPADGGALERLRIIGPPTAGTFGDPLGGIFIAAQVGRMLPGVFAALGLKP